jgi:hypothetical protein
VIDSQVIHISGRLVAAIEVEDGRLLLFRYRDASSGNRSWTLLDIVQSNFSGADADSGYASVHCTTVHTSQEIRLALDGGTRSQHWCALVQAGAANDPDLAALWLRDRGARNHRTAGDEVAATRRRPFTGPDTLHQGDVVEDQVSLSQILVCPICGFDYNHLRTPGRLIGWESADRGVRSQHHWFGRGDGFVLPIEGECGHRWAICLAFHKGQSFIFAIALPDGGSSDDAGEAIAPGLPEWVLRLQQGEL